MAQRLPRIDTKFGASGTHKLEGPGYLRNILFYSLLVLVTLAVYIQVGSYDFVNYDDPDYVLSNSHVRAGLTADGLVWAFTSSDAANWIPLTRISQMLDCQLFGLRSGLHHLTSVLLHVLSTLLLFGLLHRMTQSLWRSALVAILFAIHPLHVESVAWIAERKDVLSAFFFFVTLWAYVSYVERPGIRRYALVLAPFCLGLMAKPMIVTLPFVLLWLDAWPLRRAWSTKLLWEKMPLFALSLGISAVTFLVQKRGGAVIPIDSISLGARIGNSLTSYVVYIAQMFRPVRLAVFYPFRTELPQWQVAAAGILIAGVSVLVLERFRRRPYLAVGWFWYLGALVPVIGLVQVGVQARADRYTYIPMIGLFIMLAWGAADLAERWPKLKPAVIGLTCVACFACLILTWFQVQTWRNSIALFQHAISVTSGNYIAYNNLGLALRDQGRPEEAIADYQEAIRIRPQFPDAHNNLAQILLEQGRPEQAVPEAVESLRLRPESVAAHINLGSALHRLGKIGGAKAEFREALRLQPENAIAHSGLGMALAEQGDIGSGLKELFEGVRLDPDDADGHYNLGVQLASLGRTDEAIAQFSETIRVQPENAAAHFNLGTALGRQGKLTPAIDEFSAAVRLNPGYANAQFNLGSALASVGRFDDAISHFAEALRIRPDFTEARESLEYAKSLQGKAIKAK